MTDPERDAREAQRILSDPHFVEFMDRYEQHLYKLLTKADPTDTRTLQHLHYTLRAAVGLRERLKRYVVTGKFIEMTGEQDG